MKANVYNAYLHILQSELVVAMGCTEPIAIAYAAAKAREVLGGMPEHCTIRCSGNIIKNVMGVTVPNSGGEKGIAVAATLGIVGGDASRVLEVLNSVTEEHRRAARVLLQNGFCDCEHVESVENLYITIRVTREGQYVELEIQGSHSNITRIEKNGELLPNIDTCMEVKRGDKAMETEYALLNVRDVLDFADALCIADVEEIIERQIAYNSAISEEGLRGAYGAQVGRTLLQAFGDSHSGIRAAARAAAGSDARMSGCSLPVVINSGSGNQGIVVTLPVVEYAKDLGASRAQLIRAMVVSNLISIHQKKHIGRLSAYCGAVNAACGSGAAICYLQGGSYEEICGVIVNTIANIGGMVCDGAKASCAAKIASAVQSALLGLYLSRNKQSFQPGEGLVKKNVEDTIASVGRMGREGMKSTDEEIIQIMLET